MSLKCCNKLCQIVESIPLYDTLSHKHRVLTIGRCRNDKCGCLKGEFTYWDVKKEKFIHKSIATQDIPSIVQQFKKAPYLTVYSTKIRYGTMGNMNWKFQRNGCKYDFNNVLLEKFNREVVTYSDV